MGQDKLPKECYELYEMLEEKLKNNEITFDAVMEKLTEKDKGYWVEVDWAEASKAAKTAISQTPLLLVSYKNETVQRIISPNTEAVLTTHIKDGYSIFLSSAVVTRRNYPLKNK